MLWANRDKGTARKLTEFGSVKVNKPEGIRRMTDHLRRQGHVVNHKRVRRLMRLMGLEALYPKPRTSQMCAQAIAP